MYLQLSDTKYESTDYPENSFLSHIENILLHISPEANNRMTAA